ncbi:thiol-disulfide oxidoreductase DCC family protein [Halorientalis salina]|uniref:thiol-disulfide oxidoreductase DCC family protein n=1 Tax=Halorientalis salina TaxID=2932266 RepID=UPI0010AB7178|nr:thiol-disulfide oxidoreductase DCC family protein [Halorientalis salina]
MSGESTRDPAAIVDDLDRPVLLFDGVCNLCNGFVRFIVRFDAAGTVRFAPLQSAVADELLDRYDLEPEGEGFETVVLIEDGEAYTKSTAALRVARRLDGPWPLAYPLVYLPERFRNGVYDLVARYRYRVFGRKDECPMPDPELRERFVERSLT